MKRIFLALAMVLMAGAAKADDFTIDLTPGFTGSLTGMTNYVARGLTQTNRGLAVGINGNYTFSNGMFVGAGGINSKQANNNFEADFTAGYKRQLSEHWLYQFDVTSTTYPGASHFTDVSYVETQSILNYVDSWGKLVAAFAMEPQAQFHGGWYTYTSVGADVNLPYKFTLGGRVGYNTYSNHNVEPNYVDWTVTLSHPLTDFATISMQYTGSNNHFDPTAGNCVVGILQVSF